MLLRYKKKSIIYNEGHLVVINNLTLHNKLPVTVLALVIVTVLHLYGICAALLVLRIHVLLIPNNVNSLCPDG